MSQITILVLVILLPLVPAIALFVALPKRDSTSTGSVGGTLYGLQLKLGGAFAGYFAVLVTIIGAHNVLLPPAVQQWTVEGRLVGADGSPIEPIGALDFSIEPPIQSFFPDGNFKVNVASYAGSLPKLIITHANFHELTIPLSPTTQTSVVNRNYDDGKRTIDLGDVKLQELTTYAPAEAQTPVSTTGPSQ